MHMISSQISFAQAEYSKKKKTTRRERFLSQMDLVVPWARLVEVVEPYYPKTGPQLRGRPPIGLERMLRMYCIQQWYGLADEAVEDAVYDSQALSEFMGIDLSRESVPDSTTLMGFRHLLEANDLTRAMLVELNALLLEQGLLMTEGTLVDTTLVNSDLKLIQFPTAVDTPVRSIQNMLFLEPPVVASYPAPPSAARRKMLL